MTLFPFIIVTAALARLLGQNQDTGRTVATLLTALPPPVARILSHPIADVLNHRTGLLLWFGALVGLWTVGSYIETIRDILRRAYGTTSSRPFWQHRLRSIFLSISAIIMMMMGFAGQVILTAIEQFVAHLFPMATTVSNWLRLSRLVPAALIFVALYLLFWSLAPRKYRTSKAPKWPGALFVMLWWFGIVQLLPVLLGLLNGNTLTYGSLAGVMITLLFFWLIGYGLVIGAHLNAALADPSPLGLKSGSTEVRTAEDE